MTADEQLDDGPGDLVVVGSSAGGIEALAKLVGSLPEQFPAPLVLAQHLDPGRRSELTSILQRSTSLPVVEAVDGARLEPGTIYVVPANRHVTIHNHQLELQQGKGRGPRPSVDYLLASVARAYGEHLIAVILTGSGSDGAAGAVEVKNAGGTVIVQNPVTALYPAMPTAVPPTVIDHVAELEQIGPLVYDLLRGAELPRQDSNSADALRRVLEQISQQANIDFSSYKRTTILRRIGRRMVVTQSRNLEEYIQILELHPEEVGQLVQAFLINVTQFFRDPGAFTYLREEVLPQLVEQARKGERVLRCWSAGCATGEEAYSLAMLLADLLGPELQAWSIKIFATDLDRPAIEFARLGIYPETLLQHVPEKYRERFFERVERGYRIAKPLRQMVIFGQQDLSRSAPFPRMDLVLCRNMLIYFTPELQEYVLNRFAFSLHAHQGYLMLGKAEMVRPSMAAYELVSKQWKMFRCVAAGQPLHRYALPSAMRQSLRRPELSDPDRQIIAAAAADAAALPKIVTDMRRLNDVLLRLLPLGVAVVDRSYRLLLANPIARRLLGLHNGGPDQDFLHGLQGISYPTMRSALDRAFHDRVMITLPELALEREAEQGAHYLSLSVMVTQLDEQEGEVALVLVSDVSEQVLIRQRLERTQAEQAELLEQLSAANQRLSEMNKELVDANEELQVANEELVLTQEELQSTIEEFETTNEELQATNEELETSNEELHATNEELHATNEELQARGSELQELTLHLETERVRLREMVELAPYEILVLRGPELRVMAFNQRTARLFHVHALRDWPVEAVFATLGSSGEELVQLARRVFAEDAARSSSPLPVRRLDEQGQTVEDCYVFTLVPTHDASARVEGLLVYAINVTEQRAREAEEERSRLRLIFKHAEQIALALYDATQARLLLASPRFYQVLGSATAATPDQLAGRSWRETAALITGDQADELWQQALERHEAIRLPELSWRHSEQEPESVWDWCLTPIMADDDQRQARYMLLAAVDVTEQVRARQVLEELAQLKDEFISLASHELRTPLTPLRGYAELLERLLTEPDRRPDVSQRAAAIIQKINQQLRQLQRQTEDLVDLSRLQSGKLTLQLEPVQLAGLLQEVVEEAQMFKPRQQLRLQLAPDSRALTLRGDHVRLHQTVLNLLHNAIMYAPESEVIDVRLSQVRDQDSGAPLAQVEVQDSGPGIAEEDLPWIFDRFYQVTRQERPLRSGLGLGLYIASQIARQHGGALSVESAVGTGATFRLVLPLAP